MSPCLIIGAVLPKIADERLMYGEEMERMCIEGLRQIKQFGRKLVEIGGLQAKARD